MQFPVVLHTDDEIHYGVIVPDLPGCFFGGVGIEDALAEAREAIDTRKVATIEEINSLTAKTLKKSERGEDVRYFDCTKAMFDDLGI